ncbi:hypothetical protein DEAC_c39910 [Desulfosporosinus acididurans]|uniref:Uncharacterized protein n=2 Tax=Desulfosporosinus acididurans TaxID=476652 RepID=A0A0J1FKS5_9FIRM|nr:hypothetical protein DEAC_c39910 [Desulfosporosinus acididurans]
MMAKAKLKAKENEDQFANEFIDESKILVEVKVSDDEGVTWQRRKISMVSGLDESGLNSGEIFQFNGEKYKVLSGDDGLMVEPLKKPVEKKSSKRK